MNDRWSINVVGKFYLLYLITVVGEDISVIVI